MVCCSSSWLWAKLMTLETCWLQGSLVFSTAAAIYGRNWPGFERGMAHKRKGQTPIVRRTLASKDHNKKNQVQMPHLRVTPSPWPELCCISARSAASVEKRDEDDRAACLPNSFQAMQFGLRPTLCHCRRGTADIWSDRT